MDATSPEQPASDSNPVDTRTPPPRKGPEERRYALTEQVRMLVTQGARVESQNEYDAVVVNGKEINHTLHLILSVVTCGIWLLVWGGIAIWGGPTRQLATVDEYGHVSVQKITTK